MLFKKSNPVVITIHGFGQKASQEMKPLASFLRKNHYEVKTFDIYDPEDLNDTDWKEWIRRTENVMRQAVGDKRDIYLVGFSMGGVIASYLATVFPVKKLVLAAPAFRYINHHQVEKAGKSFLTSSAGSPMSKAQTACFSSIIDAYKGSISHISCPVLILHGTSDEVILPSSSKKAYEDLPHSQKRLVYLEGGRHRFLYDGQMEDVAFSLILSFFKGKIL